MRIERGTPADAHEHDGPRRRWLATSAAAVLGLALGAAITMALQGPAASGDRGPQGATAVRAPTFLAWVPGGVPAGFRRDVGALPGIGTVTAVQQDHAWLARSTAANGEAVDRAPLPYLIPLDTIAVDPASFATFLPAGDRRVIGALDPGEGALSGTAAARRGLTPGSTLRFHGGATIRVVAVLPDATIGGAELVVSGDDAREVGVDSTRYLLVRAAAERAPSSWALRTQLGSVLPDGLRVQVRGVGETPFLRAGDAVPTTSQLKAAYGEFAARPQPERPGYVEIDPAWVEREIETTRVPVLGRVTCHRRVVDPLTQAMRALERTNLAELVDTFDGCFAPRFVRRDPTAMLSHHAWGTALDLNIAGNLYRSRPTQDPRLVAVMERWGFAWGGRFIVPDGNHFELQRPPAAATTTAPATTPAPPAPEGTQIARPDYWLAWTPGGLPAGFRERVARLPGLRRTVVFAGDTLWLTRSSDRSGIEVDDPAGPAAVPIDAFAVRPEELAPFLPRAVRARVLDTLAAGRAVLGQRSAEIRRLGVGGTLDFGGRTVRVGAIVPEDLIGWSEVLVARDVGARLGVVHDRHAWAVPRAGTPRGALVAAFGSLVPPGEPLRVEGPRSSPYMRVANGVHPPVVLKEEFGEFAAVLDRSEPWRFDITRSWTDRNLVTRHVPLLGELTCHRAFMSDLLEAMQQVRRQGLSGSIRSTAGCFNARTVARGPSNPPSFHAYGAAVDINAPQNPFGARPTMDPRIVRIFDRLGFNWGGRFLIPDGMHFERGGGLLRTP